MPDGKGSVLAFGPFRLFPTERGLEKDDRRIPASGPAFDLLVVLVEHAGEVVSSRTLMERVWRDINVEETSLARHLADPIT
jgi:DNA-binding winged helix-turn-helix (wHTH) protein